MQKHSDEDKVVADRFNDIVGGGGKKTFLLIFKCPCERSPRVERYQRIHIYFFDHDQTACDPFAAHNVIITRANLSI